MKSQTKDSEDGLTFRPRNHREWFLLYLFNDPEFVEKATVIRSELKALVGEEVYGLMMLLGANQSLSEQLRERGQYKTAKVRALMSSNRPELLFDPNSPEAHIIRQIEALAGHFRISIATAELGLRYSNNAPEVAFKTMPLIQIEEDKVVIRLDANGRLKDIKAMFWYVEELQKQLPGYHPRNRDKERPDLIYAIYKQRLNGSKWGEIYRLYEKGELPGYKGVASITSAENLKEMYRRFKPNT